MDPSSSTAGDRHDDDGADVIPLHGPRTPKPTGPPPPSWRTYDDRADEDALTHLHGHPWFEEDLRGAARRRRSAENPWVAMVAVDGLPELETRLGAEAAVEALQAVAVRLNDSLRAADKIARLGEDRFGLIVDAPYAGEALVALERIERGVREVISAHPQWTGFAIHVGLAPLWDAEPAVAVGQAERALVAAQERRAPVLMTTESRP